MVRAAEASSPLAVKRCRYGRVARVKEGQGPSPRWLVLWTVVGVTVWAVMVLAVYMVVTR